MDEEEREPNGAGTDPGRIERARLRRRPFGYRRADVDEALETRDSELAELRQDIAALWLAFAQHDRMLRALSGEQPAPPPPAPPAPEPGPEKAESAGGQAVSTPLEAEAASIGTQLSELDEVLAAIEMATQTLERTYVEEIQEADDEPPETDPPASGTDPGEPSEG